MRTRRGVIVALVAIFVCAVIHQAIEARLSIFGARPDLLLCATCCLSLLAGRAKAAIVGFAAGVVEGGAAGANLTAYAVSRSAAGFIASWSKVAGFELTLVAAGIVTFLTTIAAELIWMFIGLRSGIAGFLGATIGMALYNGMLAIPMYALLRRAVDPPRR